MARCKASVESGDPEALRQAASNGCEVSRRLCEALSCMIAGQRTVLDQEEIDRLLAVYSTQLRFSRALLTAWKPHPPTFWGFCPEKENSR